MITKERPILFSGPMVRAILDGTKTQTRRLVKRPADYLRDDLSMIVKSRVCPYGAPGDRLWVRESFARPSSEQVLYRADVPTMGEGLWTPSIHMPRALSRIDLEVTAVRVERLHDITETDALAEGVSTGRIPVDDYGPERIGYVLGPDDGACVLYPSAREAFAIGWNAINGDRALWSSNPWVWVVGFKRVRP